ncbi:ABC transporter substrate-binding protein [Bosea lathyri]|jgi:putative spermidine/putrescine transport system substrate-binding protein|uniref:Putative spermidine/putrescine transport system substrate-binding protein n=1 Tax=Bosea lathyri TaxID=1036778 RepID=A0A1H5V5V2_9HYPH|nr:putative spermidine/putrescine transport system substrate-binding protein [Bosea lathyri]
MKFAWVGLLMTTTALGASTAALAQQKTIFVAGYGGSYEQSMRKEVIPAFEKQANVKIEYVAGNSTDTLAKLQAQKGNQQIDVAIVDDGPAYQAVALGFCGTLTAAPIYKDVAPVMLFKSNKAVGLGLVGTGFMYSKKAFEENKWPAPTSWADLKDKKYGKKIVLPPINNTYGLHALIAEAQLAGGGESNIEPGFKAFKDEINANVLAYEPSPAKMTELFQNGQAVFAVWGSGRAKAFADTGFPVEFVYPKEGGYALGVAACPIEGSKVAAEANAFIQFMLSPDIQKIMAKSAGFGPANVTVTLTKDEQKGLPYGDEVKSLKAVDWDIANAKREEWTKRWNREIER